MADIPIIDFGPLKAGKVNFQEADVQGTCKAICKAFERVGFVYLKNVGIPEQKLREVMLVSEKFFTLPMEKKSKYRRDESTNNGWVALEAERVNPSRPGDLKECFNIMPCKAKMWPVEVDNFQKVILDFFSMCTEVTMKLLDAIGHGLNIQDAEYFRKCHKIAEGKTHTTLRTLYYPPLPDDTEIKPGQIRLGEHTDYGSITLLFQDNIGGLEVQCKDGQYRAAPPVPGTVLVNIADMLQQWTSDKLVSTRHRVLIPEEEVRRKCKRQSVAFFVHPDDDAIIECFDGSGKYAPVSALDYIHAKFETSY